MTYEEDDDEDEDEAIRSAPRLPGSGHESATRCLHKGCFFISAAALSPVCAVGDSGTADLVGPCGCSN